MDLMVALENLDQSLLLFYLKKHAENHHCVPEAMGAYLCIPLMQLLREVYILLLSRPSMVLAYVQQASFSQFYIRDEGLERRKIVK